MRRSFLTKAQFVKLPGSQWFKSGYFVYVLENRTGVSRNVLAKIIINGLYPLWVLNLNREHSYMEHQTEECSIVQSQMRTDEITPIR